MDVLSEKSVIYCFENKINGKKYIGLTSRKLKERVNGHKSSVNKGSKIPFHCALRKYGIDGFFIYILGKYDKEDLPSKEIYWINKFKTTNSKFGYNVSTEEYPNKNYIPGSRKFSEETKKKQSTSLKKRQSKLVKLHIKEWVVVSPKGDIFKIKNLQKFCRKYRLDPANMIKLTTKKEKKFYKGWQCFRPEEFDEKNLKLPTKTIYTFKYKNGVVEKSENIISFCKERDFDPSSIYKILRGEKKTYKNIIGIEVEQIPY